MGNWVSPDAFRHVEDEFLEFCAQQGYAAGRKDVAREDEAYRRAITQTSSWKRNEFDTYVILPNNQMVYVDQKSTLKRNGSTGNASIELRAILAGLMSYPILSVFVRPPDWVWITPQMALREKIGGCCDDCYDMAKANDWQSLPEKCPNKWFGGSGDPWLKVSVAKLRPWEDLVAFVAERAIGKLR